VLFNIVSVIGITWLATAARSGPSGLALWVLAAVFFFFPQGLAVVELSSSFPDEGGVYAWTKREFGDGHGFLCGWCYWVNNILYYPTALLTAAVSAAYATGAADSGLGENLTYVLSFSLVALALAAFLNIVGLRTGRWLQNAGGIGVCVPCVALIALGIQAAFTRPAASTFTARSFIPDLTDLSSLNLWATIPFAFAGLELSSTMGQEIRNPRRNLPASIAVAAPLVAAVYVLGTGSLLWLLPAREISVVAGPFQGISAGAAHLGSVLGWLTPVAAAAATVGRLGGLGAWLTGPARVAFVVGLDRYFPRAFGRVHPRWRTPYVAILAQAALATVFLLLSVLGKGTTVERAFLTLLDMSLLIYFIPFVYLFMCFIRHRRRGGALTVRIPGGRFRSTVVGASGLAVTVFAMGVAMIPPPGTPDPWVFLAKVAGGTAALVLLGGAVYRRGRARPPKEPAAP
jgi:amino acid transporter